MKTEKVRSRKEITHKKGQPYLYNTKVLDICLAETRSRLEIADASLSGTLAGIRAVLALDVEDTSGGTFGLLEEVESRLVDLLQDSEAIRHLLDSKAGSGQK